MSQAARTKFHDMRIYHGSEFSMGSVQTADTKCKPAEIYGNSQPGSDHLLPLLGSRKPRMVKNEQICMD